MTATVHYECDGWMVIDSREYVPAGTLEVRDPSGSRFGLWRSLDAAIAHLHEAKDARPEHIDGSDFAGAVIGYAFGPRAEEPVKLKVTSSGHATPTHPDTDVGTRDGVSVVMVYDIPHGTTVAEIVRRFSATTMLRRFPMVKFGELGHGKIVKEWD